MKKILFSVNDLSKCKVYKDFFLLFKIFAKKNFVFRIFRNLFVLKIFILKKTLYISLL